MFKKYKSWKKSYYLRNKYSTTERKPFFEIALQYFPTNTQAIILDIGPGMGEFAECCNAQSLYENFYFLEGNQQTVSQLKKKYENDKVLFYRVPERLPFEDSSVDYIHCSHLLEHLYPNDIYKLLVDIDRVLKSKGILVISGPLIWRNFYFDLSHIRPYFPETFKRYFCFQSTNYSSLQISSSYKELALVYRYDAAFPFDEGLGSKNVFIDFVIQAVRKVLFFSKIRFFTKNGFTLVLQKIFEG